MDVQICSEKLLKDIKIILTILLLRKKNPNRVFLYLIEPPICNSAKCKVKFTTHWLRYSSTPNVSILFSYTHSVHSQTIKFAFIVFAANLSCSLLVF